MSERIVFSLVIMSMRPANTIPAKSVNDQLDELRAANAQFEKEGALAATTATTAMVAPGLNEQSAAPTLTMKDLTETERAVVALGIDPNAWKPIGFMNESHYNQLLKANALDSDLARRLEAYKHVSAGTA